MTLLHVTLTSRKPARRMLRGFLVSTLIFSWVFSGFAAITWDEITGTIKVAHNISKAHAQNPSPANIVVMWPDTAATIPAGWTRDTAFDGRFVLGTTTDAGTGQTGGQTTHTHGVVSNHTHTQTTTHTHTSGGNTGGSSGTTATAGGSSAATDGHTHTTLAPGSIADNTTGNETTGATNPTATSAENHEPPFYEVIFIKADGGTEIPDGAIAWWDTDTPPTGYTATTTSQGAGDQFDGVFYKGAAAASDSGDAGGSIEHTPTFTHDHNQTEGDHANGTTGTSGTGDGKTKAGSDVADDHTHTVDFGTGNHNTNTDDGGINAATGTPPHIGLVAIENTSASASTPDGIIAMWTGDTADIPADWTLCQAGGSCDIDIDKRFAMATSTANVLTVGGDTDNPTHDHAASAHSHTNPTHTHTTSITGISATTGANTGGGGSGTPASNSHTHTGPTTGTGGNVSTDSATIDFAVNNDSSANENMPPYVGAMFIKYTPPAADLFFEGTLYDDEGVTEHTAGGEKITVYAGTSTPSLMSTTTIAGTGLYRFNLSQEGVTEVGFPIAVWVDDNTSYRSYAFTKASSTSNNIEHQDLYQNRIIIRHAGEQGTSTNFADLNFYDVDEDVDIQFKTNGSTMSVFPGQTLYVASSTHFAPEGDVTLHANASGAEDGDFKMVDSLATSSIVTLGGDLIVGGSFFASSTSLFQAEGKGVRFSATTTGKTITGFLPTTNTANDNDVASTTFAGLNGTAGGQTGEWTFLGNASTSAFSITDGTVIAPSSGLITIGGNYENNGTTTANGATFYFSSSTAQSLSGSMTGSLNTLGSVTFLGAATKTFSANASTSAFTIGNGATVDVSGRLLSITGQYDNSQGGTLTTNSSTFFGFDTGSSIAAGSVMTEDGSAVSNALGNVEFKESINFGSDNASTTDFKIEPGITVTAPSGGLISVRGNFTNNGTFTHNSGTLLFHGSSAQTINGTLVELSALGNVHCLSHSLGGVSFGAANASTSNLTISQPCSVTAPSGTFSISGDYTNNDDFNDNSATVLFDGAGAQTLSGEMIETTDDFAAVHFMGGGTKTFSAAASTTDFTIDSGVTIAAPSDLSISGTYTNNGTFTSGGGANVVLFDGTSQTLSGNLNTTAANTSAFNHAHFMNSGTKTVSSNASTTDFIIDSGVTVSAPTLLMVAGDFTNSGTYATSTGTLYFDSTSAQSISGTMTGASDFGNIEFVGSGTKTLSLTNSIGTTTNLRVQSGATVDFSGQVLTIHGDYTNNGTIATSSTSKFFFSSTSAQSIAGVNTDSTGSLPALEFLGSGTKTFSTDATTTELTIDSGATVVAPLSGNLSITGNYTNNGNFTDNSGTVLFDGAGAQTLSGEMIETTDDFAAVHFMGGGTKTVSSVASTTDFTIDSGVTVAAPSDLSISGNYTNNGSFTDGGGSNVVLFDGTTQTISGNLADTSTNSSGFNRVHFSNSGTKTLSGNATTTDFVIDSGVTVQAPTLLTVAGDFTNSGTYATSTGTLYFDSTSAQSISGTMTGASDFGNVEFVGSGTKTISVTNSIASSTNLTIQSGVTVDFSGIVWTLLGDFVQNGTIATSSTSKFFFSSTSAQTLSGTLNDTAGSLPDVEFLESGTKTISANASTTAFTIGSGATVVAPSILSVYGTYDNSLGGEFQSNSGTFIFASSSSLVSGSDLTEDSAGNASSFSTVVFEESVTLPNASSTADFIVKPNVTLTAPSSGLVSVGGDLENNGIYVNNSATLLVDGSGAQSLSGTLTGGSALGSVEFSGASTKTFSASASTTNFTVRSGATAEGPSGGLLSFTGVYDNSLGGAFRRNGSGQIFSSGSSIQSGSVITGDDALGDVVFEQSLTLTNASTTDLIIADGVTLTAPSFGFVTIEGDFTSNGTYLHNNATTSVSSTTAQTLTGTFTDTSALGNIEFLGAGNKTFSSNASTTHLTIDSTSGTFIAPVLLTIEGDYVNDANFTDSGGTVYVSSTTAQNLSGGMADTGDGTDNFNDIVFLGASTKTLNDNASTSAFTIESGATVVAPENGLLTISGVYDNSQGGTYTHNAATLYFDGSATIAASSVVRNDESESSGLGNVVFSAGTVALPGNASTTNLTIDSGTLDLSNLLVTVEGDYTNNATVATSSTSRFYFSSTSAQTLSGTLNDTGGSLPDVEFILSGTKTISNAASTSALTIGAGATIVAPAGELSVYGAYDNSAGGTFTHNSGSIIFAPGSSIVSNSSTTDASAFASTTFETSLTLPGNASTTDLIVTSGSTLTAPTNGLLSVSGNFTQNGTYASSSATILFDGGSGTQTISGTLISTSDLGFLTFSGGAAKTFSANASTTDITILSESGTVTFPGGANGYLSLTGDFTNNGTFASNSGTTSVVGTTTQTFSGTLVGSGASTNNSFANLSVENSSGDGGITQSLVFANAASTTDMFTLVASTSVQFPASATSSFQNINWDGGSSVDTRIWLRSSSGGSEWGLDVLGVQEAVEYLDAADSNACSGSGNIVGTVGIFDSGGNTCWTFPQVSISSAANQTFTASADPTAISTITITDGASGTITAANDLRIVISTTTAPNIDMTWDTTDTTATFGGGASGNVSNPVSYEGEGSVLVIPVDKDFDPNESFTIAGLSFANFNTATASASVLSVRAGGAGDTTDDDTDDKTISIIGTFVWAGHSAGQIGNQFSKNTTAVSARELFAFRLTPTGENMSITELIFSLSSVTGISQTDITNAAVVSDSDNDLSASGETTIWSTDSTSITGGSGSITFSDSVTVSAATDYILTADIASVNPSDDITIDLNAASDFTATGVLSSASITPTGPALSARHQRITGGGGGVAVGAAAPDTDDQGGGTGEGGEEIGSEVGFETPAAVAAKDTADWTNADDGRGSDDVRASASTDGLTQEYTTFGFSIPSGNTIDGIEVRLEANGGTGSSIGVELAAIGIATTTSATTTGTMIGSSDVVYTVGSPSYTFGRTWSPSDFNDGTFVIKLTANINAAESVNLDAVQVKVYNSSGGGGGGGGGEVRLPPWKYLASALESLDGVLAGVHLLLFDQRAPSETTPHASIFGVLADWLRN